jgi:prepilin-type N-terminal cleavage/methylation domain-containing protein
MKLLGQRIVGQRCSGFTLLELLIVCGVVGVLATFALGRLWSLQQDVEEIMAEQVVGALKSGVRIHAAELIGASRWDELREMPQRNPFDWLEDQPENYRGELKGRGELGNWYFDKTSGAATYFVKHADGFRSADGSAEMRFFVVGLDGSGRVLNHPPFAWVGIRPQAEYVWLGRILR